MDDWNVYETAQGKVLLLVEDDEHVRKVTARMLEALEYTVIQASGGRDAQIKMAELQMLPDIAVIDVLMPDMDGFVTLELLRERAPDLPALFVSGFGAAVVHSDLPEHSHFISKPFSTDELGLALYRLLPPDDRLEKSA